MVADLKAPLLPCLFERSFDICRSICRNVSRHRKRLAKKILPLPDRLVFRMPKWPAMSDSWAKVKTLSVRLEGTTSCEVH